MDGPADRDSLEDLQSEMAKWREAERLAVQHGSLDGIQVSLTGQHGVAIRALCVVVNEVNQDVLSLGDAIDGVIRVIDGLTRAVDRLEDEVAASGADRVERSEVDALRRDLAQMREDLTDRKQKPLLDRLLDVIEAGGAAFAGGAGVAGATILMQ